MRLSRFAPEVTNRESNARVGFAEALCFDVRQPENEDDAVIAQQRVAGLHHVPLLLVAAHLLGALAILFNIQGDRSALLTANIIIPMLVVLSCDMAAYALLRVRDRD